MSFRMRASVAALISILFVAPASAENKKVTLSQAFQSMLYLPLYVAIAVHSGPWIENCALPEITAESATVGAPAVSLVKSRPCWVKKPSSIAT